ncbi:LPXTG cell wall anchor domain-containing protein [Leucobacter weissii]|uniref:LPXTG cell wall anchor domain-containing protein n=1 Tax=Leucobacter weissii TaxID=1983706 RepID=A0A939MJ45_9MICO|nr:DUF5979 domain-containing protein [Leucobacter weissii]MBO1901688.1 LPXTG cell wall anchor domain-containing protein [Leucobacter weissii]
MSAKTSRAGRRLRGGGRGWLASVLALLLFGTASATGGVLPAAAMEGASLLLVKTVNGKKAERDLRPGDSVTYKIEFRVNDEDADAPVRVVDELPAEFAGWRITGLTALVGGSASGVVLDLPGIAAGDAPSGPVEGTIGASAAERTITVGVERPVQAGAGNASGLGMPTTHTGELEYTLTVPEDLSPDDPLLRRDLTNTATFSAKAGAQDLSRSDSAVISVDNPIAVDVEPRKSWTPAGQSYEPGRSSTVTIGARQTSNVDAAVLRLQDPASAPDGATSLSADNPFTHVDFAGFTAPADPAADLPTGADSATVEVYRLSGGAWNWTSWNASIPNSEIGGVRIAYAGAIPPGTSVSQGFTVEQRSTHRGTGAAVSEGYDLVNDVRATVEVPGHDPVSKETDAPFAVAPEQIDVSAQKRFRTLPSGSETTNLTGVTAGDTVGVVLRAINETAPRSTTLDRLVIREPGAGSHAEYFGDHLRFDGFDDAATVWPAGATSAELRWDHPGGPTTVDLSAGAALPTAPAGVTGFEIAFAGSIEPGAYSEIRYRLATSADDAFVAPGATAGPFRNVIDVVGARDGLPDDTASAHADLSLVSPRIDVTIDKRVGPSTVLAGQTVVVQLDASAQTVGGRTKPTEIVVEDALSGDGTFWDAFDAREILPPITRPVGSGSPATQADLAIRYRDAAGDWHLLVTNPDENTPVAVPSGATGLRFVYSNPDGLSQATYVKPNISFTARGALRSDGSPTAGAFDAPELYENVATAEATGHLDGRVVTGRDRDEVNVGVRGTGGGTGPGPGGVWTAKDWAHDTLTSQSSATTWTTQSWALTENGYEQVRLQDPAAPTATGAGTVFEAFDLTHIRPIRFDGVPTSGTVDPSLRWDVVTAVQLWDGEEWRTVAAPGGSWMDANGFTGYALSGAERGSTLGVRLVLEENTAARQAAEDAGDLTAPAAGSGVSASAQIRSYRLDWQLRETARAADGSLKWVKENGTAFNCGADDGCIDNVFGLTAIPETGAPATSTSNDTIQLIDGVTNVGLSKQVRQSPDGALADGIGLVVPNPGELAQEDFPRARYTLTARNVSTAPDGSRGAMKLGKIRVTDTSTHQLTPAPAFDIHTSPFAGRDFATEVAGSEGNHFDVFDLTGIAFGALPGYIDTADSAVELWLHDGTAAGTTRVFTLQEVIDGDADALLGDVIGIAVTFSSADPETNGNRIAVGDDLTVHLDVRLRATERLSGDPVRGGGLDSVVNVPNEALARGWDAVVAPANQPTDTDEANVSLRQARVLVDLDKSIEVDHGDSSDGTVYEAAPEDPVSVTLTADPAGSTAPLNDLSIQDDTASFWERFAFVSFGEPGRPTGADRATLKIKVGGDWIDFDGYDGDLAEIRGAGVVFDRADGGLFPQGATSWNASWGTATLPFTVELRSGAAVDWSGDEEENVASVIANNEQYGRASTTAEADVDFSPGTHRIEVIKRAPNDTGTHQVTPLTSQPWRLVFTNTGTGYLPITAVTDALPESLSWDGEAPTFESAPGSDGATGLSDDPADVGVTLAPDGRSLVFEWPAGSRMHPGETMTIGLGLILQPLPTGQRATNEVTVATGVPLASCTQPTNFGQHPSVPAAADECGNTNFVQPRSGTVVGAVKTVNGEVVDTLGEDLVSGAMDVRTGEACAPGNYRPIGSDYTRNPCASYTAVGATDSWKLEHINSGTNALSRLVIVDLLPQPGDKMLAGGASRGSTFQPVLVDPGAIRVSGLPAGAEYTIDVTTNPTACVGPVPGESLWVADPECSDSATNPGNVWTPLSDYTGDVQDIAGLRIDVDLSSEPLQPAGSVVVEFETVNRVLGTGAHGLEPSLAQFEDRQFAWNQNGVIGWDTLGNRVNLPAAPQRAGVTVQTGSLEISKTVLGDGAEHAPDSFAVELECTVPSGVADPERVPLDLGDRAELEVPNGGSVAVTGIPIGADCSARESGAVGAHGETGRSIASGPGVTPASDGLSATIKIREHGDGEAALLNLANTYTLGELIVEKSSISGNEHDLSDEQLERSFAFELVCTVSGSGSEVRRTFSLEAGEQHRETGLPEGAACTLTETDTGAALSTTITVSGEETEGATRDGIVVAGEGSHVLVSNVFDGPPPPEEPERPTDPEDPSDPVISDRGEIDGTDGDRDGLPVTGAQVAWIAVAAMILLGAGAGVLLLRRRRTAER